MNNQYLLASSSVDFTQIANDYKQTADKAMGAMGVVVLAILAIVILNQFLKGST